MTTTTAVLTVLISAMTLIGGWILIAFTKAKRDAKKDELVAQTLIKHTEKIEKLEADSRGFTNLFNGMLVRMEEVGYLREKVDEMKDNISDIKGEQTEINKVLHQIHIEVIKIQK